MKIPEILLVETEHKPGSLARVLKVVGESGLLVENRNAVRHDQDKTVWELTLERVDPRREAGVVWRPEPDPTRNRRLAPPA